MKLVSAVQPTNKLTLGNYLGAIKNFSKIPSTKSFFFIADLHALTMGPLPNLEQNIYETLSVYLASGLSPLNHHIFLQSTVPAHYEMKQMLSYFTHLGELYRQAQFKEKSDQKDSIPLALFDYPVLMAGDILLYNPDAVPVGSDQAQHLELTREIAYRINQRLNLNFTIPKALVQAESHKIMSLQNPIKKMSKSDPDAFATIFLSDTPEEITKKFKRAVTDSGTEITYNDDKPGIKNLINIQVAVTNKSIDEIVSQYEGKLYGYLKKETVDLVIAYLSPLQKKIKDNLENKDYLKQVLKEGQVAAHSESQKQLALIKQALGLKF